MESSNSSNCVAEPEIMATLSRKEQTNQEMVQESNKSTFRRVRQPEGHRRSITSKTQVKIICGGGGESSGVGEDSDEKAEVEKKIVALQKIVPGGESLCADKLFEETAGYIMMLQHQIKVLRFFASFVEGPEIETRKLGG